MALPLFEKSGFFYSVSLIANDKPITTFRSTYAFFDLLGDLGGISGFFTVIISQIVSTFSSVNLNAQIANSLYSWIEPPEFSELTSKTTE